MNYAYSSKIASGSCFIHQEKEELLSKNIYNKKLRLLKMLSQANKNKSKINKVGQK